MLITNFADGTSITEKTDENPNGLYWDNLPDKPISALQLTLPVLVKARDKFGKIVPLPAPTVTLSNYDKYYFANQAVSTIFAISGTDFAPAEGGRGALTHQIIAGFDFSHDICVWLQVDRYANIITKHFPIAKFNGRLESLRLGVRNTTESSA